MLNTYRELAGKYSAESRRLNKIYNTISMLRLAVFILFAILAYYYLTGQEPLQLVGLLICVVTFMVLMKRHQKISFKRDVNAALLKINQSEVDFLEKRSIPFENGNEFINPSHPYSYDLDIFGNKSFFHQLNRTYTLGGKQQLADLLLTCAEKGEIEQRQEAVKELVSMLDWRQYMAAMASINRDNGEVLKTLTGWANLKRNSIPKILKVISYLFPVMLGISMALGAFINDGWYNVAGLIFVLNLLVIWFVKPAINEELGHSDNIEKILGYYGLMLKHIEQQSFKSKWLINLKSSVEGEERNAGNAIRKLSSIYRGLNTMYNLIGDLFFNGFALYHLHQLRALYAWRDQYAGQIKTWLEVIGRFEAFNSLANYSYNNPAFIFPAINDRREISFVDLGHPLLDENSRICNDVAFQPHRFIILTGSNMSGKSTFLRSLGLNVVLSGIGAPVCATAANVHPFSVFVSMRLSDSLSEHESYFYAEVKRLKQIMDFLENKEAFILLDEILRGTNSDDKRSGTVSVIEKMVGKGAIGAIATHDLEVCKVTDKHPGYLVNKCFEVEIEHDELHFDYKLRDGICRNKNASFLMRKMNII